MRSFPSFAILLSILCVAIGPLSAQEPSPLRLTGLYPSGMRSSVTERWCEMTFAVANFSDSPREARVVVFFDGQEYSEYARDLWVPARVSLTSSISVGPVPKSTGTKTASEFGRTIHTILYDRTSGTPVVVRPAGEERLRDRMVLYRKKSEVTTALFTDDPENPDPSSFRHPTTDVEALSLVRVVRSLRRQSESVTLIREPSLPTSEEAYDGIDQIVVAGNRLNREPASRVALRRWVERGGQLWILLDQVEGDILGSLLGSENAPQIVDRTSLTRFRMDRNQPKDIVPRVKDDTGFRNYEHPVAFVRVALTGREKVHHTIDTWPAAFSFPVGRGKILVTTLGPAGWYRPRIFDPTARTPGIGQRFSTGDPPSPYESVPDLPVGTDELQDLFSEAKQPVASFSTDALKPLLLDEIGYAVPGRGTVATLLAVFVAILVGIGFVARRAHRTEIVALLVPVTAIAIAGLFYLLGGSSRHAIPPTDAIAEIVDGNPSTSEVARLGLFATYQPESGTAQILAPSGGVLDMNFDGLEGQNRVRLQTDRDSWHYEKLSLPAGIRQGTFRTSRPETLSATATFGPNGVTGTLASAGFREPADAILVARNRETSGVRISSDGSFAIGPEDALSPGQYHLGTILSDRQQRRQAVYRAMLDRGLPEQFDGRDFLMAWATPNEPLFQSKNSTRSIGTSLLVIPVEYRRPAPGTSVAIPRACLPYRRDIAGWQHELTLESVRSIEMRIRFQLPMTVLPMTVESATFHAKVRAPSRRVALNGYEGQRVTPLTTVESPTAPIQVRIVDPKMLQIDKTGGIHVGIAILGEVGQDLLWTIESLGLELKGRTAE